MDNPLLSVNQLNAYYGKSQILQKIAFSIAPNEKVAILGRNGMGKTTLMKSILGLSGIKREGSILLNGEEIIAERSYKITKDHISYVPQGWLLFPSLSVEEHLQMAYQHKSVSDEWTPKRVLDAFPEIERRRRVGGTKLSGGEQQLLAIGRALVRNAEVILMDEPSEGVSTYVIDRIKDICDNLAQNGVSVLLVEQNLDFALRVAQKVYILVNGQIVLETTSQEFGSDKESQNKYLGI